MSKSARYSYINCPSCGKMFKFLDSFDNDSPAGKVMKCPKCNFTFAFRVSNKPVDDPDQMRMDFSADPSDKEAFNRYVEAFKRKFGETSHAVTEVASESSDTSSED